MVQGKSDGMKAHRVEKRDGMEAHASGDLM